MFHVSWTTPDGRDSFTAATAEETLHEFTLRGLYERMPGLIIKDPGGVRLTLQDVALLAAQQLSTKKKKD